MYNYRFNRQTRRWDIYLVLNDYVVEDVRSEDTARQLTMEWNRRSRTAKED